MEEIKFSPDEYEPEDFTEVDAMIAALKKMREKENGSYFVDPTRLEIMRFSCAAIKKVLREAGCAANVECGQSELSPGMGHVTVESKDIDITNMEWFARAAEFADNTEVYPLTNGRVRLTFTFNRLLKKI